MGLDMYLSRNLDQNGNVLKITPQDAFNNAAFAKLLKHATQSNVSYLQPNISVNIAYWRKANAIHQWFISHCAADVDNCQAIAVDIEDLHELKDTCDRILNAPTDIDLMESLLPPQGGFFFGDTDLNDTDTLNSYLDNVEYTNHILSEEFKIVDEFKKHKTPSEFNPEHSVPAIDIDYTYQASW